MKQKITILLAILFSCYSFGQVGTVFTSGGINYRITSESTVKLSNNTVTTAGVIVIPTNVTYNNTNYSVTSIEDMCFVGNKSLTSITIPNSVTSIGYAAFSACSSLTSITISNTVTSIGNSAFEGCKGLTAVIIPNSVASIGDQAFMSCTSLTAITIPNSVTSMGKLAFQGCTGLITVTIGNSVTIIEETTFFACSSLTSVTIGTSVTTIGKWAFNLCPNLTSITLPNSITNIGVMAFGGCKKLTSLTFGNSLKSISDSAFEGCSGLTSVTFGNSLGIIGEYAFANCSGLTSLNIPASVGHISLGAFYNCSNLKSVDVNWQQPININPSVFSKYYKPEWGPGYDVLYSPTVKLNVPAGTGPLYKRTEVYKTFNPIVDPIVAPVIGQSFISKGINYIVTKAVERYEVAVNRNVSFVGAANIPNSVSSSGNTFLVTSIVEYAFSDCGNLTSVVLPDTMTNISLGAFTNCKLLTSITIPNSIISISESAFNLCTSLTTITIPKAVTNMGNFAFAECTSLTTVNVNWTTPLIINSPVFSGLVLSGIKLNVPAGTATAYKAANVWKDFGTISTLSTNTFSTKTTLKFYPNPTQSQINFSQEINTLEVFDIAGKKVKSFQIPSSIFDVSTLEKGVYFLKGKTIEGKSINEKLVKE